MKKILFMLIFFSLVGMSQAATYYIDFVGGSDANNGTSTSTPWKRQPYMTGWAGGNKYTHAAGDRFIFKGGVVWTASWPMTINVGGSSSGRDYYGVDQSWFTGGAWSQPVFDGGGNAADIIKIGTISYLDVDNFEIRNIVDANSISAVAPIYTTLSNLYIHNWRRVNDSGDGVIGGIYNNYGGAGAGRRTLTEFVVTRCRIDNADGDAKSGVCVRGVGELSFSYLGHAPELQLHGGYSIHDNVFDNATESFLGDAAQHPNATYIDNFNGVESYSGHDIYFYNNVLMNMRPGGAVQIIYPNFGSGGFASNPANFWCFNNIILNSPNARSVPIDAYGAGSNLQANYYFYNNTFENSDTTGNIISVVYRAENPVPNRIEMINNHFIGPAGTYTPSGTLTTVDTSNYRHSTISAANTNGFTAANYYSPTSASGATVNSGTNLTSKGISLLNSDTSRGGNKTPAARPASGAWDIGAYEYGDISTPNPAHHYIRADASAGGNGTNWTQAWSSIPASLIRGNTYYIADGNYGTYTFGPTTGSGTATILKAIDDVKCAALGKQISECRGTAADGTNFQSSFDGQAVFPAWKINSGDFTIDGQKGSGGLNTSDRDYGFKVQSNTGYVVCGGAGCTGTANNIFPNITIKHTEIQGGGDDGPNCVSHNKGMMVYGGTFANWNLTHNYIHDFGNMPLDLEGLTGSTLEYNYIARNESYSSGCGANNEGEHAEGLYSLGSNNSTIRYNVWEDIEGTGVIMLAGTGWKVYGNLIYRTGNLTYSAVSNGSIAGWSSYAVTNSVIANNTVANCMGTCGINFNDSSSGNTIQNNFLTSDASYFVDYDGPVFNFHLTKPTSAGTAMAAPYNMDMDGKIRGSSGVWDLGAYEFGGSIPVSTSHPADSNSDFLMALNEATKYGACWKNSSAFADCPAGIAIDYAVRAGTLWAGSATGQYQYNSANACPLCWEVKP